MTKPTTEPTFRDRVLEARPDAAEQLDKHARKRALALRLRSLRKQSGKTQKDIERISGLNQAAISRLESPTGAIPQIDTLERYVSACGGHLGVAISLEAFDEATLELVV